MVTKPITKIAENWGYSVARFKAAPAALDKFCVLRGILWIKFKLIRTFAFFGAHVQDLRPL